MLKSIVFLYEQLHHIKERDDLQISEKLELAIRLRMRVRRYVEQWIKMNGSSRIIKLMEEFKKTRHPY